MNLSSRNAVILAFIVAQLCGLGACTQLPPAPVSREQVINVTATIEALDRHTRMLVLRGADGRKVSMVAGPKVQNFEQINVGDEVIVNFYEAIAAEVTTPEQATQGVQEESAVIRAAKGERPAGAIAETLTTTVEIESVDTSLNTVTFRRADGMTRVIAVEDPNGQAFIRELKRGDLVRITYMEAVAVSVRPADGSRSWHAGS